MPDQFVLGCRDRTAEERVLPPTIRNKINFKVYTVAALFMSTTVEGAKIERGKEKKKEICCNSDNVVVVVGRLSPLREHFNMLQTSEITARLVTAEATHRTHIQLRLPTQRRIDYGQRTPVGNRKNETKKNIIIRRKANVLLSPLHREILTVY